MSIATAAKRTASELARNAKLVITNVAASQPKIEPVVDELVEQLAAARADLASARRAADEAVDRFAATKSGEDDSEIEDTERAVALAERRVDRAERRIAARNEERAAEKRAELKRRRAQLITENAPDAFAAKQAQHAADEAAGLIRAAEARAALWEMEFATISRQRELASIAEALGEKVPFLGSTPPVASTSETIALLSRYADTLPAADRRRSIVGEMIAMLAPNRFRRSNTGW